MGSFWDVLRLRFIYCLLAALIAFAQLLPLETAPRVLASPDWLLCLTVAWTIRRPDVMSPILVAVIMLLADFVFHRPPGLWTLLVTVVCVLLSLRGGELQGRLFLSEWGLAIVAIVAVTVAYQVALLVTFLPLHPLMPGLVQLVLTILAYPLVTTVSRRLFGVSWPDTAEGKPGGTLA